jgi:hypothetical protein
MIQKTFFMLTMHLLVPAILLAMDPMAKLPVIDGKISHGEWQQAKYFDRFITTAPDQDQPNKPTQAWFGFDQDNLYIAFDCVDSDTASIKSNILERDGTLWFDDCVEFFFKPIQSRSEYYHFIINPRSAVFDQLCRPNEIGVHKDWNAIGITVATGITPSGWQMEARIPLSNFPIAGNVWAMNLARTSQIPTVEYSSIQGMKNGFHRPEAFRIIEPQFDTTRFAPGIEILDVGQRQVGENTAKIRLINEQGMSGDASLQCAVVTAGKTSSTQSTVIAINADRQQIVSIPYHAEHPGPAELHVTLELSDHQSTTVGRTLLIRKIEQLADTSNEPSRRYIDKDQALVVNGDKVFPLIFYRQPTSTYSSLKTSGFNCAEVTNYRPTFDVIRTHLQNAQNGGIGLLPHEDYAARRFLRGHLKKVVRQFMDHPNLWAWYLADEPQNYGISPENAVDLYHAVKQTAPDLPVFLLNSEPKLFERYAPACDIFGVDCYPVPTKPISVIADYIDEAHKAVDGKKPVWFAAQTYGSFKHGGRMPTLDEGRCMIYLALAHGVKGMLFFAYTCEEMGGTLQNADAAYYDMVLNTGKEIQRLSDALTGQDVAQEYTVKTDGGKLHCRLIADQKQHYLLTVNPTDHPVEASISSPLIDKSQTRIFSLSGQEQIVANQSWQNTWAPFAVKVYILNSGVTQP